MSNENNKMDQGDQDSRRRDSVAGAVRLFECLGILALVLCGCGPKEKEVRNAENLVASEKRTAAVMAELAVCKDQLRKAKEELSQLHAETAQLEGKLALSGLNQSPREKSNGLLVMTKGEIAHTMLTDLVSEARHVEHVTRLARWIPEFQVDERKLVQMQVGILAGAWRDAERSYQSALTSPETESRRLEMMTSQWEMARKSREAIRANGYIVEVD
jgi:hypothetical protein